MSSAQPGASSLDRLWREYKRTQSPGLRDQLLAHYMHGPVPAIARRLRTHLPVQVELADLVSVGYVALEAVLDSFDPAKGVGFTSFANKRLRGSMIDYLRELDPVSRLDRRRAKILTTAEERFRAMHGREPDDLERQAAVHEQLRRDERRRQTRAGRMDPEKECRHIVKEGRLPLTVSLTPRASRRSFAPDDGSGSGGAGDAMATLPDCRAASPLLISEREDLKRWITQRFERRDRLILILYYFEQLTMKQIGRTLGCSESRISQRLDLILKSLRSRLRGTGAEREFE